MSLENALRGNDANATRGDLLHLNNSNAGLTASYQQLYDGTGETVAIYVSTLGVQSAETWIGGPTGPLIKASGGNVLPRNTDDSGPAPIGGMLMLEKRAVPGNPAEGNSVLFQSSVDDKLYAKISYGGGTVTREFLDGEPQDVMAYLPEVYNVYEWSGEDGAAYVSVRSIIAALKEFGIVATGNW